LRKSASPPPPPRSDTRTRSAKTATMIKMGMSRITMRHLRTVRSVSYAEACELGYRRPLATSN
jgi:hypothetical protein